MPDLLIGILAGAGFATAAYLALWVFLDQREEAREREGWDARPAKHSLEARAARTQRFRPGGPTTSGRRVVLEDGEPLVRPYVSEVPEDDPV